MDNRGGSDGHSGMEREHGGDCWTEIRSSSEVVAELVRRSRPVTSRFDEEGIIMAASVSSSSVAMVS